MDSSKRQMMPPISEAEILAMLDETSELAGHQSASQLSSSIIAAQNSSALANNVEFWQWMARNYRESGIFNSSASMQSYLAKGPNKAEWLSKQVQGKGYEWDWMKAQRENFRNLFKSYDAGDVVNRAASDVTEHNLLTGANKEYQMKAYTSKKNPDLKTTPKDMTVVTNSEKVGVVQMNGYTSVEEFQDAEKIKSATQKRMKQVKNGTAQTAYTVQNVAGTMAQAGLVGCIIGVGTEAVLSYRSWKQGRLTDQQYLQEIMKSGGDAGVTASASAGIMIPVSAAVTAAGASSLLTIPVAFVISSAVNKVVAPCFGRGQYREILSKARYYQSLDAAYSDLVSCMQIVSQEYYSFICSMAVQNTNHQALKEKSSEIDQDLEQLLYSI